IIKRIQTSTTKTKEPMAFVRIEDPSGELEVVLFPDAYRKWRDRVKEEKMVMVRGRWQGREQGKVIATTIEDLKLATIWIKPKHENTPTLERLKQMLTKRDGAIPVRLRYERTGKGVALPLQK